MIQSPENVDGAILFYFFNLNLYKKNLLYLIFIKDEQWGMEEF